MIAEQAKQKRLSIAIVGAGLGGLTAALALASVGWTVRVYEQAPVLGEAGAGITISSGAARGLAWLGLGDQLLVASLPVPDIAFLHYRTGALLAGTLDAGAPSDFGLKAARHIHRADLHHVLLTAVQALDPQIVVTNHRLESVIRWHGGVRLRFANGAEAEADLLIGADGIRSTVRHQLFGSGAPTFSKQVAFRCLVPAEAAAPFMGFGNAAVWVGPKRIFNRYAIRRGTLVNIVGLAQSEYWSEEGWTTPASLDEFLTSYADFHPSVTSLIKQACPNSLIKWGIFVRPPIGTWHCGHAVLLGDAAHPILPFLGLGAALAIEDGIVLARALRAAPSPEAALRAFEATRVARVDLVRRKSILQGEIIQSLDPDAFGLAKSPAQDNELFAYDPLAAVFEF